MNWLAWPLIVLGVVLLIVLAWLLIRRKPTPPAKPVVSDVDLRPAPEPLAEEEPTGEIPVLIQEPAPASNVDGKSEPGRFPGSVKPLAGGASPSPEYTIKGNADSMLYHAPESPYHSRTKAEVWFRNAADAEAAGFTAWNRRRAASR